jgi:hypothetical protein
MIYKVQNVTCVSSRLLYSPMVPLIFKVLVYDGDRVCFQFPTLLSLPGGA